MNKTDRELLELAAKAAGYVVLASLAGHANGTTHWWKGAAWGLQIEGVDWVWNPLVDDGDALRLAVKLGLAVSVEYQFGSTSVLWGPPTGHVRENHDDDLHAATRRAIVRAAAEIGRTMK